MSGCCRRMNVRELTVLARDGTRHWLSISNVFLKNIKVKGSRCLDYEVYFVLIIFFFFFSFHIIFFLDLF